jgi:hypothetical protein
VDVNPVQQRAGDAFLASGIILSMLRIISSAAPHFFLDAARAAEYSGFPALNLLTQSGTYIKNALPL